MAKTRHRQAHKQRLAARRRHLEIEALTRRDGQPVEVGKGKHKVAYNEPEPENLPLIRVSALGAGVAPGDVLLVTDGSGRTYKARVDGQDVPIESVGPEGVTLADAPPKGSHVLIGVDPAVPGSDQNVVFQIPEGQTRGVDVGKINAISLEVAETEQQIAYHMGVTPNRLGPSHLEMAFTRGDDGKPIFGEISLCPGPDPNGITDLKDPE